MSRGGGRLTSTNWGDPGDCGHMVHSDILSSKYIYGDPRVRSIFGNVRSYALWCCTSDSGRVQLLTVGVLEDWRYSTSEEPADHNVVFAGGVVWGGSRV